MTLVLSSHACDNGVLTATWQYLDHVVAIMMHQLVHIIDIYAVQMIYKEARSCK